MKFGKQGKRQCVKKPGKCQEKLPCDLNPGKRQEKVVEVENQKSIGIEKIHL